MSSENQVYQGLKAYISIDKVSNYTFFHPMSKRANIYRKLKIFKILSSRYRNRKKRFGLRFNLIAGIYNYELSLKYEQAVN